jgi:hypothetical protein
MTHLPFLIPDIILNMCRHRAPIRIIRNLTGDIVSDGSTKSMKNTSHTNIIIITTTIGSNIIGPIGAFGAEAECG